jgi:hypothetical protein
MRRVRRAWYYVRSFFRPTWTLDDYPIAVRDQRGRGDDVPPFVASIDGLFVHGFGETPNAAREDLAKNFEGFRAERALPRPGTQQPLVFASTALIDAHGELRDEFLERVLHMGSNIFVSDESSLSDFPEPLAEYKRRIMLLYGVDVEQLQDDRLITILDAIARR